MREDGHFLPFLYVTGLDCFLGGLLMSTSLLTSVYCLSKPDCQPSEDRAGKYSECELPLDPSFSVAAVWRIAASPL